MVLPQETEMTLSRGQTFSGDVPHDIVRFGIRCAAPAQTAFDKLIQNGSQLLLRFKVTGDDTAVPGANRPDNDRPLPGALIAKLATQPGGSTRRSLVERTRGRHQKVDRTAPRRSLRAEGQSAGMSLSPPYFGDYHTFHTISTNQLEGFVVSWPIS